MRTTISLAALIPIIIVGEAYLTEKPPFIHSCCLSDPSFEKCYASNFQALFREWKDGVPGLRTVGKLDPLEIVRLKITQPDSGTIALRAEMTNVAVKGLSSILVQRASFSRKDHSTKVDALLPKIRFDADYKVNGRVLSLKLNGQGKAYFEAENVRVFIHIRSKLRDQDAFTFADISEVKVTVKEIGAFHIHLDNLFGGQKELEDNANALFNESWRDLYETLRPVIEQTNEAVLLDRFKKIFEYVPVTYFVADIPKEVEIYE